MNDAKKELLQYTNANHRSGKLSDVLKDANVFIGVSKGNLLNESDIRSMAPDPIILAMANPIPEIMPDVAKAAGAAIVGTGRSDFPNQINNVLVFPGIFRGALDASADRITESMKLSAARALADCVQHPTAERIVPDALDRTVAPRIATAIRQAFLDDE